MTSSKVYEMNYKRLVLMLLPTMLRKPLMAAIASSMASPVTRLYRTLMQYRQTTNYRLWHNGQTCYLRALLNDMFDVAQRRITVTDCVAAGEALRLPLRDAGRPLIAPARPEALVISRRGFGGAAGFDFIVNVPGLLGIDETRMRAIINSYKLACKRYDINYV